MIRNRNITSSSRNQSGCTLFVILGCIISLRNSILILKNYYVHSDRSVAEVDFIPIIHNASSLAETVPRKQQELSYQDTYGTKQGAETAAGCLLIMDDNHFLIEWIAYHFHVVNLRRLIIAIDPRSRTLPDEIVHRWRDHMNISIWYNYSDYNMTNETAIHDAEERVAKVLKNAKEPYNYDLIQHRARQRLFYSQCMIEHQQSIAYRGWTLFLDTDEFVSINYPMIPSLRPFYHLNKITIPSISEPGSVLKLLQYEQQYFNFDEEAQKKNNITSSPCIQIPRFRYGTIELPSTNMQSHFSESINTSHYATFRWKIHANTDNYGMNRISKTIIDLSRIPSEELYDNFPIVESIHKPLPRHCARRKLHIRSTQQLFIIHHYLGTYEQYTFRDDSRSRSERTEQVCIINHHY